MSFDGNGNYTVPSGTQGVTGQIIDSVKYNAFLTDLQNALSKTLLRDGQAANTADQNWGGFKLKSLGAGTARMDALNAGQVQDNLAHLITSVGGSGNAITGLLSTPPLTTYVSGLRVDLIAGSSNSGATTLNINSIGARSIKKPGGLALEAGDIVIGGAYSLLYNGTDFLIGAASGGGGGGGGGTGGGTDIAFFEGDTFIASSFEIGASFYVSGAAVTIASPAVWTLASHGYVAGQMLHAKTTGALPTGMPADTVLYVLATGLTTDSFQVALTAGGVALNTSGSQSGVHSVGKLKNAVSAGPVTIGDGATVTVPTGSSWTVV